MFDDDPVCDNCIFNCAKCKNLTCAEHEKKCLECKERFCNNCLVKCLHCKKDLCKMCEQQWMCNTCNRYFCEKCTIEGKCHDCDFIDSEKNLPMKDIQVDLTGIEEMRSKHWCKMY